MDLLVQYLSVHEHMCLFSGACLPSSPTPAASPPRQALPSANLLALGGGGEPALSFQQRLTVLSVLCAPLLGVNISLESPWATQWPSCPGACPPGRALREASPFSTLLTSAPRL